jgi:hypothetical protein
LIWENKLILIFTKLELITKQDYPIIMFI